MTESDSPLSEALSFVRLDATVNDCEPLTRGGGTRPTRSGINLLAIPHELSSLAFRGTSTDIQAIVVNRNDSSIQVAASWPVEAPVVFVACSADARLVAVALADGSLCCLDVTHSTSNSSSSSLLDLSLRWTVEHAHSHTNPHAFGAVGNAAAAGPVRSLSFSPGTSYHLLLVDSAKGSLSLYNAAEKTPVDVVLSITAGKKPWDESQVLSAAAWCPTTNESGSGKILAVGHADGTVQAVSVDFDQHSIQLLASASRPQSEEDEEEEDGTWSCTHLDWFQPEALAIGYCRVTASDDNDSDEDGDSDEDDSAEHEACLYIASIHSETYQVNEWSELGDVAPYFGVPKQGRHVYFTTFLKTQTGENPIELLLVGSNVSSEIGVASISREENTWHIIELQEGNGATTPTNDEDEFFFPVGLGESTVDSKHVFLLASTDGSIATFDLDHRDHPDFFNVQDSIPGPDSLPATHVPVTASAVPSPPTKEEKEETPALVPEPTPAPFGGMAFGSGGTGGLTFGSGTSSGFSFGETSAIGSASKSTTTSSLPLAPSSAAGGGFSFGSTGSSIFGSPTPVKDSTIPLSDAEKTKSVFGAFGSSRANPTTFGSASSAGGGFGALAASPVAATGFGALAASPVAATGFGAIAATPAAATGFGAFSASPAPSSFGALVAAASSSTTTPSGIFGTKTLQFGFGSSPFSQQTSTEKNDIETVDSTTDEIVAPPKAAIPVTPPRTTSSFAVSTTPLSPTAQTAASAFDNLDTDKKGTLHIDKFEELLDELGEGFHGDEFDKQVAIIDPDKKEIVDRTTFINWYSDLVSDKNGDDE
eukprot:scaffold383833_cov44-Attheya_sp.AAC.1